MNKQISLTMPETLFRASKDYSDGLGYRTVQEFVLDLVRNKVVLENLERYKEIEARMGAGKGARTFSQKGAVSYLKNFGNEV
jgi:hypothetical protein